MRWLKKSLFLFISSSGDLHAQCDFKLIGEIQYVPWPLDAQCYWSPNTHPLTQPGETASCLVPLIPLLSQTKSVLHTETKRFSKNVSPSTSNPCLKLSDIFWEYRRTLTTISNGPMGAGPHVPVHPHHSVPYTVFQPHGFFCLVLEHPKIRPLHWLHPCLETLLLHLHRANSCISTWSQLKVHPLRAAGTDHLLYSRFPPHCWHFLTQLTFTVFTSFTFSWNYVVHFLAYWFAICTSHSQPPS